MERRCPVNPRDTQDWLAAFANDDPEKKLVLTYITRLVTDGYAEVTTQRNGEIEVRFASGEIYLLAESSILRLT